MLTNPPPPLVEMTAEEFRAALDTMQVSKRGAQYLFLCDDRTPRRWASGDFRIPPATAALLRLMIRFDLNPDDVMESIRPALKRGDLKGYKGLEE